MRYVKGSMSATEETQSGNRNANSGSGSRNNVHRITPNTAEELRT